MVCVTQRDSAPAKLVYWFCTMARIWRVSRLLPGVAALPTLAFGQLEPVPWTLGPVNVESEMLFQSTWNFQMVRALVNFQVEAKKLGVPGGGVPVCKRAFDGMSVNSPA